MRAATRVSPLQLAAGTGRFMQKRGGAPGKFMGKGIEQAAESKLVRGIGAKAGIPLRPFGTALRTGAERLDLGAQELKKKERERKTKRIDLLAGQLLEKKRAIEKLGLSRNEEERRIDALAAGFALDAKNAMSPGEKIARIAALDKANMARNADRGIAASLKKPGEIKDHEDYAQQTLADQGKTVEQWAGTDDARVAQELKDVDQKLWSDFLTRRIHRLEKVLGPQPDEDQNTEDGKLRYEDRLNLVKEKILRSRDLTPEVFAAIPLPVHTMPGFAEKMAPYMTLDKLNALQSDPRALQPHADYWKKELLVAQLSANPREAFERVREKNPELIDSLKNNPTFNAGIKLPDFVAQMTRPEHDKLRNSATDDWVKSFFESLRKNNLAVDTVVNKKDAIEELLTNP
jgi:hypothetical protein